MSAELHLVPNGPAPDNDPFARFDDQARVDAEFASMFDLVVDELGQDAVAGAGLSPLTAENIEAEVAQLYQGFDRNDAMIRREREEAKAAQAAAARAREDQFVRLYLLPRSEEDDESNKSKAA